MNIKSLTGKDMTKAIVIGVITAIILAVLQIIQGKMGVSPFPKPVSLAFASGLLGKPVPLPLGLLFHVVYVTFWTVVFVAVYRNHLTFWNAFKVAMFLWIILLIVFFPFIGWGFLGLSIGPKAIVGSFVIHLLFAIFTWWFSKIGFKKTAETD
jgi:hypothetical protein